MYETQLHVLVSYRERGRELLAPSVVCTIREAEEGGPMTCWDGGVVLLM